MKDSDESKHEISGFEKFHYLANSYRQLFDNIHQPHKRIKRLKWGSRILMFFSSFLVFSSLILTMSNSTYSLVLWSNTLRFNQAVYDKIFLLGLSVLSITFVLYQLHKDNLLQMEFKIAEASVENAKELEENLVDASEEVIYESAKIAGNVAAQMEPDTGEIDKDDLKKELREKMNEANEKERYKAAIQFVETNWDSKEFKDFMNDAIELKKELKDNAELQERIRDSDEELLDFFDDFKSN